VETNASDLSIGTVAARTGVAVAVLRSWQERFGFPAPTRSASGHRRYGDHEVEQILHVVEARAEGLSLQAAIDRVLNADDPGPSTIATALRRRHPDLAVNVWPARALLATSRAIEDECLVNGRGGLLIGSFQRRAAFATAERRWREAVGARGTIVVLADDVTTRRSGTVTELPASAGLAAEWAVISAVPGAAAFLGGRQLPGQRAVGAARRFECVLTVEPSMVVDAAQLAIQLIGTIDTAAADEARAALPDITEASATTSRRAISILNRALTYSAATSRPSARRRRTGPEAS